MGRVVTSRSYLLHDHRGPDQKWTLRLSGPELARGAVETVEGTGLRHLGLCHVVPAQSCAVFLLIGKPLVHIDRIMYTWLSGACTQQAQQAFSRCCSGQETAETPWAYICLHVSGALPGPTDS